MAGGGQQQGRRGGLITSINVTPLVDIMLVLLIVFMLTADLIANKAIEVDLPTASSGSDTPPVTLSVTLKDNGELFLEGQPTTGRALRAAVREAVERDAKTQVVIDGDKMVSHGRVVWVIDAVKTAGVSGFAINVDPGELLPPPDERGEGG